MKEFECKDGLQVAKARDWPDGAGRDEIATDRAGSSG